MRMRAAHRLAASVLCVLLAAGCTDEGPVDPEPTATPSAAGLSSADAAEAGRLRLQLERQFATFGHRALEAAQARAADSAAAAAAVSAAIDDLAATVASAYDESVGDRFAKALRGWVRRVNDHAESGNEDPDATRARLLATAGELAEVMTSATDDGMAVEGTAALLREPLRATATAVTSFAEGEFDRAYLHHRLAYGDLVSAGQAFAAGISEQFPDRYGGPRSSGPLELQSALQQLLVEHALLAGVVTRRGAHGRRDFDAAAAALNGNTEDVVTALDSVYGAEVAAFEGAWRDRISLLAEYTVAAADERSKRRDAARAELRRADGRIGAVLEDVSDETMARGETTGKVRAVTQRLLEHVDAYVGKQRSEAQDALGAAETAAADLAEFLAEGIVAHRPDDFEVQ